MSSSYDSAVIDVALIEDPRLLAIDRGTRLMHLEAIVWCKARLTDGFIPLGALPRFTDEEEPLEAARVLVDAGVWEAVSGGWQIVGFTDTQMSAARVRELRESARERYDNWKRSHKRVANGAANGPARPPAPPARKGGGQRVVGEDGGEALAGTPPLDDSDSEPRPMPLRRCPDCSLYFNEEEGHECPTVPPSETVEERYLRAVEGGR